MTDTPHDCTLHSEGHGSRQNPVRNCSNYIKGFPETVTPARPRIEYLNGTWPEHDRLLERHGRQICLRLALPSTTMSTNKHKLAGARMAHVDPRVQGALHDW